MYTVITTFKSCQEHMIWTEFSHFASFNELDCYLSNCMDEVGFTEQRIEKYLNAVKNLHSEKSNDKVIIGNDTLQDGFVTISIQKIN